MSKISTGLITRYSAGPSAAKTKQVKSLHEAIRGQLPSGTFETFLQGSYRNGTSIADINDVDIVALRKGDKSPQNSGGWEYDFNYLLELLSPKWTVKKGDKCVKLSGAVDADIVPAIRGDTNWKSDPVVVFSRSESREIPNFPRRHVLRGQAKQSANGNYKATVRLFKRWARQYKGTLNIPSFYLECAVYQVPNDKIYADLPLSLASVGLEICSWEYSTKYLGTVAGDKDILVSSEWSKTDFETFKRRFLGDLEYIVAALKATSQTEADRKWKLAFGD